MKSSAEFIEWKIPFLILPLSPALFPVYGGEGKAEGD